MWGRLEVPAGVSEAGRLPACPVVPRVEASFKRVEAVIRAVGSVFCNALCASGASSNDRSWLDRFHVGIDAHKYYRMVQITIAGEDVKKAHRASLKIVMTGMASVNRRPTNVNPLRLHEE